MGHKSIQTNLELVQTAQIGSKSEFGGRDPKSERNPNSHLLEAVEVDAALDGEHPVVLEQRGPGAFNLQFFSVNVFQSTFSFFFGFGVQGSGLSGVQVAGIRFSVRTRPGRVWG